MNLHSIHKINVAIDGPAGAGKSTGARKVAEALCYVYVDTGAMYRTVTLKSVREGIHLDETARLIALTESLDIQLVPGPTGQRVYMDGEDVTESIRSEEVTNRVSLVSAVPEVRSLLVFMQRQIAEQRGVVMDGRDIGTNVMPDAEVKVFLTASVQVRADRRYKELSDKGVSVTLDSLIENIADRDRMDTERKVSPLKKAEDAVYLDTSDMTIEDVVESILTLCRSALGE